MDLVLVGLNHKTAPVEVRERIAFAEGHLHSALKRLQRESDLQEGMIVSTCNRVEILAHGRKSQNQIVQSVKDFLYSYHTMKPPFLEDYLYSYLRHDAVRHIFRVASSLDSMVVGEPQILSQVKQAYTEACQAGSVGTYLKDLIPRAFFVAKKVRSSTRIGASAVSISSVAVELARKIFGDLRGKTTILLGAGEMGELAARNLLDSGVSQIFVTNRTPSAAGNWLPNCWPRQFPSKISEPISFGRTSLWCAQAPLPCCWTKAVLRPSSKGADIGHCLSLIFPFLATSTPRSTNWRMSFFTMSTICNRLLTLTFAKDAKKPRLQKRLSIRKPSAT